MASQDRGRFGNLLVRSAAAGLLLLLLDAGHAVHASSSTFGPSYSAVNTSPQIDFTLTVDKVSKGAATLDIFVAGDLNTAGAEDLQILINGVQVASFTQSQCGEDHSVVSIPAATLAPLIAGGQITLSFRGGRGYQRHLYPGGRIHGRTQPVLARGAGNAEL